MLNPHALAQSEGIKMSNLASREVEGTSSSKHRDEADLARLGKRSVLKVWYRYNTSRNSMSQKLIPKKAQFRFFGGSRF